MTAMQDARSALCRLYRRLPLPEGVPLFLMLVSASGLWAFVELADEVMEGDTRRFDRALILAMRHSGDPAQPLGPAWMPAMARDVTAFGSTFALVFISFMVIGWLLLGRRAHGALLLGAALGGGALLANLLKLLFGRPRPDLVAHGAEVFTTSFPSSHALVATTVYLTLGAMVMRFSPTLPIKIFVICCAVALSLLIGLSRVYLGVHWPSDVLAGWALGAAWASFVWLIALWLQRRGEVEQAP